MRTCIWRSIATQHALVRRLSRQPLREAAAFNCADQRPSYEYGGEPMSGPGLAAFPNTLCRAAESHAARHGSRHSPPRIPVLKRSRPQNLMHLGLGPDERESQEGRGQPRGTLSNHCVRGTEVRSHPSGEQGSANILRLDGAGGNQGRHALPISQDSGCPIRVMSIHQYGGFRRRGRRGRWGRRGKPLREAANRESRHKTSFCSAVPEMNDCKL